MFGKKSMAGGGKDATLVAESTKVVGNVTFSGALFVNGQIEGDVRAEAGSEARLVVSEVGCVKGEVHAPFVVVDGRVEGNVHASTRVELAPKARIKGNVYYKLIEMQLGAMVDGQLVHVRDDSVAAKGNNIRPIARAENERREAWDGVWVDRRQLARLTLHCHGPDNSWAKYSSFSS